MKTAVLLVAQRVMWSVGTLAVLTVESLADAWVMPSADLMAGQTAFQKVAKKVVRLAVQMVVLLVLTKVA